MSEADAPSGVEHALRPRPEKLWRTIDFDGRRETAGCFIDQLKPMCTSPMKGGRRNGARAAERIEARLKARARECLRQSARDLQRLAEIEEGKHRRAAEAARRRWFVLGRLLSQAASEELFWAQILDSLVQRSNLSAREARALGQ